MNSPMDRNDDGEFAADRGIPSLDAPEGRGRRQSRGITLAILGGLAVLLIGGGVALLSKKIQSWRASAKEAAAYTAPAATRLKPLDPPKDDGLPLPPAEQPASAADTKNDAKGPVGPQQPVQQVAKTGAIAPPVSDDVRRQAEAAKRASLANSDPLAFGRRSNNADGGGVAQLMGGARDNVADLTQALQMQSALQPKAGGASPPATLDSSLKSTAAAGTNAQVLLDPSLTMTQGTVMTCALETALDSTVPGYTKCNLTEDVYSTDGRTLLAERGSTLIGQYESSSLKAGMSRIFLLWTRLETIKGVVVSLDSPAIDALGRGGVEGKINNHFWQRFGAGLLLSIVDDVTASASNRSGNQQVQFSSTTSEGQNAATIALQHSVDIPPTLTKNQGGIVKVFVARDLYFGNVYGFRTAVR